MSSYTNPGEWCKPSGGIKYISTSPLVWELGYKGSGYRLIVPEGTVFDVSIPQSQPRPWQPWRLPYWALREVVVKKINRLFNPHDPHFLKAAALHDTMLLEGFARTTAGAEFHEALKADQVVRWKRLVMWLAVSLFKYK
jgi:hypothetical protein